MTIEQAEIRWEVKAKTIFSYIQEGKINNLSANGTEIILPNIEKPYIAKRNIKLTTAKLYEIIIKACNNKNYIDVYLLNDFDVSSTEFSACLKELEEIGILKKNDDFVDYNSNIGFTLTYDGKEKIETFTKKALRVIENIKPDTFNINVACVNF